MRDDILDKFFKRILYILWEVLKVSTKFFVTLAIFWMLRNTNIESRIESWGLQHPIAVCGISFGCLAFGVGISFLCIKKEIAYRPLHILAYMLNGCSGVGIAFMITEFYIIPKIYKLSEVETTPEITTVDSSKILIVFLIIVILVVLFVLWRTIAEDGLLVFGIVLCIGAAIAFGCFSVASAMNHSLGSASTKLESQSAE